MIPMMNLWVFLCRFKQSDLMDLLQTSHSTFLCRSCVFDSIWVPSCLRWELKWRNKQNFNLFIIFRNWHLVSSPVLHHVTWLLSRIDSILSRLYHNLYHILYHTFFLYHMYHTLWYRLFDSKWVLNFKLKLQDSDFRI